MNIIEIPNIQVELQKILAQVKVMPIEYHTFNKRVLGQYIGEVKQLPEHENKSLSFQSNTLFVDIHQSLIVKYDLSLYYKSKNNRVNTSTPNKEIRKLLAEIELEFLKRLK